jgi:hypothetical protein
MFSKTGFQDASKAILSATEGKKGFERFYSPAGSKHLFPRASQQWERPRTFQWQGPPSNYQYLVIEPS